MGEVADMMLDGTLCHQCGAYIDEHSDGVPRLCDYCDPQEKSIFNEDKEN